MPVELKSPDTRPAPAGEWSRTDYGTGSPQPMQTDPQALRNLLETFEPITLNQMAHVALLDRSELIYVLPQSLLLPVLADMRDAYRVLVVAGQPMSRYRTLYFDTPDLALYRRHHAGAPDRYKVRAREYMESHVAFLEVKHKMLGRRTVKSRIPTSQLVTALTPEAADFVAQACPYPAGELSPRIWNHYTRITLVSKLRPERVTLDLELAFVRERNSAGFPDIVVAEVKYQDERHASEFVRLIRAHHICATGFSKYCMGVSLLYPNVKHNKFKAKHRMVARLSRDTEIGSAS